MGLVVNHLIFEKMLCSCSTYPQGQNTSVRQKAKCTAGRVSCARNIRPACPLLEVEVKVKRIRATDEIKRS